MSKADKNTRMIKLTFDTIEHIMINNDTEILPGPGETEIEIRSDLEGNMVASRINAQGVEEEVGSLLEFFSDSDLEFELKLRKECKAEIQDKEALLHLNRTDIAEYYQLGAFPGDDDDKDVPGEPRQLSIDESFANMGVGKSEAHVGQAYDKGDAISVLIGKGDGSMSFCKVDVDHPGYTARDVVMNVCVQLGISPASIKSVSMLETKQYKINDPNAPLCRGYEMAIKVA